MTTVTTVYVDYSCIIKYNICDMWICKSYYVMRYCKAMRYMDLHGLDLHTHTTFYIFTFYMNLYEMNKWVFAK